MELSTESKILLKTREFWDESYGLSIIGRIQQRCFKPPSKIAAIKSCHRESAAKWMETASSSFLHDDFDAPKVPFFAAFSLHKFWFRILDIFKKRGNNRVWDI